MARVFKTGVTVEGDLAANSGNITSSASTLRFASPAAALAPTNVYLGYHGASLTTTTNTFVGGSTNSTTIPTGVTSYVYVNSVYGIATGGSSWTTLGQAYSNSGTHTVQIASGSFQSGTSTVNINTWGTGSGTQATVIGSTGGTNTLTIRGTSTQSGAATFSGGITFSGANSPITLGASNGLSGQVLTSSGAGTTPTWTTPSSGATGFDPFMLMGA